MKKILKKTIILISILTLGVAGTYNFANAQEVAESEYEQITGPRYGEDSVNCVLNLSLYREFYRQWKLAGGTGTVIEDAIRPWRWVFLNCPLASQNVYIDGVAIVEYLIAKENTPEKKEKLIDTLMMVYDQRIAAFGREGYVLGRKGVNLINHRPNANEELFNIFHRSVQLQGNESEAPVLAQYFRYAERMVRDEKIAKEKFFEIYDQTIGIINHNVSNATVQEASVWENIRSFIEQTLEPYATCDDLIAIFGKKLEESPEDLELIYKVINLFDRKGCTDAPLYLAATLKSYELDPSPQSAYAIGRMYFRSEKYQESIDFLKESEKLESPADRADGMLLLANSYKETGNKVRAREAAYKAIMARPDDGNPYIFIGDLYAASTDECGTNELTTNAVYWAAVDKYTEARRVDSSVASEATQRINIYSKYFPSIETIFFYGHAEGESFTVECWINETTTIRAAN
jgi:tetratricopeptide (TPR) repeat protein